MFIMLFKCAIKTKGAAGPSGLDADIWKRAIGSKIFGNVSEMTFAMLSHSWQDNFVATILKTLKVYLP